MRLTHLITASVWAAGFLSPTLAHAQRTDENAVSSASDAFGQAVGSERIGLYSNEDVRGFSPIEAGNARIEGMYFVQTERPAMRIIDGSTIRVGISAQGYPFPAPTGIVDYRLNLADGKPGFSLSVQADTEGSAHATIEGQAKLSDDLGAFFAMGPRYQRRPEGGDFNAFGLGASLAWRPYKGALIAPFFGTFGNRGEEAAPLLFPGGNFLPPKIKRGDLIGQDWADRRSSSSLFGLVTKLPLGDWRIEAGLFRSQRNTPEIYADLFLGLRADGSTPNRTIVADANNRDFMTSGEFRISRTFAAAGLSNRLTASIRGRQGSRRFGGVQRLALGESSVRFQDERPQPLITFGADDRDSVRQFTYGVGWTVGKRGLFSLDAAISRSDYRKSVDFASPLTSDFTVSEKPWAGSFTGSVFLAPQLVVYGGHVRGFEEALIAPDVAINRGEAPPAIRTRQSEIGLRYAVTPKLNLVAGLFSIRKPYFSVDGARLFRQLGVSTNRGVEISLSGSVRPGLSIVAGTVIIDPVISGPDVAAGVIGRRPVGSLRRRSILNLDWRLDEGKSPFSIDVALESLSGRTANIANSLSAPARETINLGFRYRFPIANARALLRIQANNLLGDYGWIVSPSSAFTYSPGRNVSAELLIDI